MSSEERNFYIALKRGIKDGLPTLSAPSKAEFKAVKVEVSYWWPHSQEKDAVPKDLKQDDEQETSWVCRLTLTCSPRPSLAQNASEDDRQAYLKEVRDLAPPIVALLREYRRENAEDDAEDIVEALLASTGSIIVDAVGTLPPKQDWTQPEPGVTPYTVRLAPATPAPTSDIALWTLIKLNAQSLSWDNYQRAIELIFDCDSLDSNRFVASARSLSRRRALPFTDTDSYRALKVATEAFFLSNSYALMTDEEQRTAIEAAAPALRPGLDRVGVAPGNLNALGRYIAARLNGSGDTLVPYLAHVARNLEGTTFGERASSLIGQWKSRPAHKARSPQESERFKLVPSPVECDPCSALDCWEQVRADKMNRPLTHELIYVYWCEEAMLMQTMNALVRRFQNVRSPLAARDPLAGVAIDPLRGLSSILFGFAQDEQHRLTMTRRAYEYSHEYGLALIGQAVPALRPADHRSKFIEAFHTLLNLCAQLYRQADDTTVVPDGFPVLNALREVHILLSEGAHNQFGDLPATARIETMMQQWILARPELREFLPRRAMVNLPEPWMASVESMRRLQGWGDTSVLHFWQLANFGEQIVASIRWGNWAEIVEPASATNWALFFRAEVQTYMHAYRAVTSADLHLEPVDTQMPAVHLLRRQVQSRRRLAA